MLLIDKAKYVKVSKINLNKIIIIIKFIIFQIIKIINNIKIIFFLIKRNKNIYLIFTYNILFCQQEEIIK